MHIYFETVLVCDTRRMKLKNKNKWQRHFSNWCWSSDADVLVRIQLMIYFSGIERRQQQQQRQWRWQLQHCWLFQSCVYNVVNTHKVCVCAPRALLNKQDEKSTKKAGHAHYIYYHLLHLHIKFNGFINIFELLICIIFSVRSLNAFVRCPSSTHCRHSRVPFVIRACIFFHCGFFSRLLIYGKSIEPLKWCAYNSIISALIGILCMCVHMATSIIIIIIIYSA